MQPPVGKPRKPKKCTAPQNWVYGDHVDVPLRVVKGVVPGLSDSGEYEVLLTNLPRDEFPAGDVIELYFRRWEIETSFRDCKYSLCGACFRSTLDEGIIMEMWALAVLHNLARAAANLAFPIYLAKRKGKAATKYAYRIDFGMRCTVVIDRTRRPRDGPSVDPAAEVAKYVRPVRPGRSDPRNLKEKSAISFVYRLAA